MIKEACQSFTLADITIGLELPEPVRVTENFLPFAGGGGEQITVRFLQRDVLPECPGEPLFSNVSFSVFRDEMGFFRRYHDHKEGDIPYAIGRIAPDGWSETVEYLPDFRWCFSESHNSFSHIGLEELLLYRDRVILHASFISSPLGGILFTGPSGVGKSTQAGLWETYMESTIINGDRPILGKTGKSWTAYGSPYAGSSRCHRNEKLPIRAIVKLEQGAENRVWRLTSGQAFHGLFAQMTVNSWNPDYVEKVCDLTADLVASVPVYRMICTPDRRAVETLKSALEGDG